MQHLFRASVFNVGTARNQFHAHSPYHQFIEDIENKRSKLFPDRRRVPGRKAKYIIALASLVQFWAVFKLTQVKKSQNARDANITKLQRKVLPYFESLQDVEYTVLKHRNDLILAELFKEKGGIEYLKKHKRFHNEVGWAPNIQKQFIQGGTGRYQKSRMSYVFGRELNGFDIQNV